MFQEFRVLLNKTSKSCLVRVNRYLIHLENKKDVLNNIKGSEKDKVKDIAEEVIVSYVENIISVIPIILFDVRLDIQNILNFAEKNRELLLLDEID